MPKKQYPKEFLALCQSVTAKRPRTVITHILEHGQIMPEAALQIDHRVPFEVAGESETMSPDEFMLLCGSANRAKSWSCEHCDNWTKLKKREVCLSCYWAYPENHSHIAMQQLRRVDLLWQGDETKQYERLKADAAEAGLAIPDFVKDVLRKALAGGK